MTEIRHLMRRLIVYYMMRLLITIRDRRGASQHAFRRLVIVWPSVLVLTVAALWLAHDILWNLPLVAVEHAASVPASPPAPTDHAVSAPPPLPPSIAATHGMANVLVAWMENYVVRLIIGAGVIFAGAALIMGNIRFSAIVTFAICGLAITQWSTITEIVVGPNERTEQVAHDQLAASKRAPDCQLIWFGPAGYWQCK
jgi:hypothetical protein